MMNLFTRAHNLSRFARTAMISGIALSLFSCASRDINTDFQSENYSSRVRFLVMHYTVSDWQSSLTTLTKPPGGVSSHYLIPETNDETYQESDLQVYQLVDESQRAWHAGPSSWEDRSAINDQSIGIELVNQANCIYQEDNQRLDFHNDYLCDYKEFSEQQIQLLIKLSKDILKRHPQITPTRVVGHADIQPEWKSDPGPRFPWYTLYQHGIGAWYDQETLFRHWQQLTSKALPEISQVQCALKQYGYGIELTGVFDEQTHDVIRAFELHFRPWQADGFIDYKTTATLWALLEKYFPHAINPKGEFFCHFQDQIHQLAPGKEDQRQGVFTSTPN
ncbi:N-acetylmuramoyl-L-alanine amidase [Thalassotalea mangrovi]|uniref:N-acetylmuramoyl-L-alanine amidase n=1 Tax=Thalassotalea mangrovi TaxID=2572245 RepID=A0A4U1B7C3_9GAMM|nr:N-acetylmuramoyl-L-alanine amidase [Thalassotalea mangrovi]TKB46373.1 N-acetylmuramoyl-L-alanine amidase [Thalassotalea mangrovi]